MEELFENTKFQSDEYPDDHNKGRNRINALALRFFGFFKIVTAIGLRADRGIRCALFFANRTSFPARKDFRRLLFLKRFQGIRDGFRIVNAVVVPTDDDVSPWAGSGLGWAIRGAHFFFGKGFEEFTALLSPII